MLDEFYRFSGHTIGTEDSGYSLVLSVAPFQTPEESEAMYLRIREIMELDLSLDETDAKN